MASAQMYSTSRPVQPTAQDAPIPLPADPIDPLAGPSGATAQTGGFVQGGTSPTSSPPSGFGGGFGVGLASSPNVPRPGSSIDPVTGKPHTAGLTRAELEAKKAAEASSSSALTIDGKRLDDLSGREQAARQLTGTADDVITPGHELPGGWGRESSAIILAYNTDSSCKASWCPRIRTKRYFIRLRGEHLTESRLTTGHCRRIGKGWDCSIQFDPKRT